MINIKNFHLLNDNGVDIKNRHIFFTGGIESPAVDTVVNSIHFFNKENANLPITLHINSEGGYDDAMFYLYDAIVNSQAEIHTVGSGIICSAATLPFVAGDKRFATECAMFMTHKAKSTLEGDDDEIRAGAEFQKTMSEKYWKLIERHTTETAQFWYDNSKEEGELWLNAQEMLKHGAIDEIIKPPRRILKDLSNVKLKTRRSRRAKVEMEED